MGMEKPPRVISQRLQCWLCAIPFFGICIVLLIGFANIYRYSGGRKYMFCYFFACCLPMLALFAAAACAIWALQGAMGNSVAFAAVAAGICCVACWCGSFLNVCMHTEQVFAAFARAGRAAQTGRPAVKGNG